METKIKESFSIEINLPNQSRLLTYSISDKKDITTFITLIDPIGIDTPTNIRLSMLLENYKELAIILTEFVKQVENKLEK